MNGIFRILSALRNRYSGIAGASLLLALAPGSLSAQTFTTLANFDQMYGVPANSSGSSIVQGPDGNFYGTASGSGSNGTVFKVTPSGTLSALYTFTGGKDGVNPQGGVIVGSDGNLYGASASAIFKLTLGGTLTVLNSSSQITSSTPLIQASDGNFYSTTNIGFGGIVYKMTPAGVVTVLYTFLDNTSGHGFQPGPLIQGMDGNLYGTTATGGGTSGVTEFNYPTVFKISTGGSLTTLADLVFGTGGSPTGPLVQASDGNFYGVDADANVAFKMTPAGAVTTFYNFCNANGCPNGSYPTGALIQGQDGNLYGTTEKGGAGNSGTIFQLTLAGNVTTLYSFCAQSGCKSGGNPTGSLYQASNGTFYGTTGYGGANGYGTVYSFQLPAASGGPSILNGGIVNAASYAQTNGAGNPVAPGALVTIFTSQLSATAASFNTSTLPSSLGGVSVTFNGITAPMVQVVPSGQYPFVSAQVPFEITPGTASVVINVNGTPSAAASESVVASQPGIFTIPATGQGNAILIFANPATSQPAIAAPSSSGITYPTAPIPRGTNGFFYVTGLGAMTPSVPDGSGTCPAPNSVCNANATPQVFVGGISAPVGFAGQAPGFPGVFQVNITIPENAPTGSNVSLVVKSADGSVTSNTATIAVQ